MSVPDLITLLNPESFRVAISGFTVTTNNGEVKIANWLQIQ